MDARRVGDSGDEGGGSGWTIVYFDHAAAEHGGAVFRSGEAGLVWPGKEGGLDTDTRVAIPPNSLHALHGLGVIAQLNRLEILFGRIGQQTDAMIAPSAAPEAARIFYEADRRTYGEAHDLLVWETDRPEPTQYRLKVDNRGYQRTLSQLQFLASCAMQEGMGIRMRI